MESETNPYAAPTSKVDKDTELSDGSDGLNIRAISAIFGFVIGFCSGVFWTIVFGPYTDGPPSIALSALVYITGFSLTGIIVGLIQRLPGLIGPAIGVFVLTAWAFIVGPKDEWIVIWVIIFGGSGFCWGLIIGMIFWAIRGRKVALMTQHNKALDLGGEGF